MNLRHDRTSCTGQAARLGTWSVAAWWLLATGAAWGQPMPPAPDRHFQQYGWLDRDTTASGLEVVFWKPYGSIYGAPERVYLGIRSTTPLTQPLKLNLEVRGSGAFRTSIELPPQQIVLPKGSGGARGKYQIVPLVFPGSAQWISVDLTNPRRGRTEHASCSWWGEVGSLVLHVIADPEQLRRVNHSLLSLRGQAEVVHPLDFPQRWPLLAGFLAVAIDLPVLRQLQRERPRAFEALRNWVLAGGQLLVRADFPSRAQEVTELLRQVSQEVQQGEPSAFRPAGRLSVLLFELQEPDVVFRVVQTETGETKLVRSPSDKVPPPETLRRRQALARSKLPAAWVGAGLVALVPRKLWLPWEAAFLVESPTAFGNGEELFPLGREQAVGMFGTVESDLRIPGLGNPPVFVFLGLISAFVLVVGPVNYFWFRYRGSLHRLLITVPGTALLATGALLGYVFWSEGLDHKGRFLSLTLLDRPTGKAITWAKGAYFSAIPPRQGLRFAWDTAVFLQPPGRDGLWGERTIHYQWDTHQQVFLSGWLQPRRFTNVFLARVSNTGRRLQFRPAGSAQRPPRVTNQLDTRVELLVAKDAQGRVWFGRGIAAGETATLSPAEADPGVEREMLVRLRAALSGRQAERTLSVEALTADSPQAPNALLWRLRQVQRWLRRQGANLPPGHWVAVAAQNPELPTGIPLHQRQSLHVFTGRWP